MKRFMVFCGDIHYPSGGMDDFKEDFEDVFEAIRYGQSLYFQECQQWVEVYDLKNKNKIYEKCYQNNVTFELEKEQFLKTNLDLPLV